MSTTTTTTKKPPPPKPPPTKSLPTDLPIHPFPTSISFESFLTQHHLTSPGIYLKLAKKSSGHPTISGPEAVELALCFGWIDGRANAFDADWWLVRFTPRRANSIWSRKNVETVERLLKEKKEEEGGKGKWKMREAGLKAVEAAKADGRWERAYKGPATITVPEDFAAVLAAKDNGAAAEFFERLSKSDRYAVLWRVETASPRSRAQRIEALVKMLGEGKVPGAKADAVVKVKKNAEVKKGVKRKAAVKKTSSDVQVESALPTAADDDEDEEEKQPRRSGLRRRTKT